MLNSIRDSHILFVVMPWAYPDGPALGPSILQTTLQDAGFDSQVFYPGLEYVGRTGADFYQTMATDMSCYEVSEHFFSCCLHGNEALRSDTLLELMLSEYPALRSMFGQDPRQYWLELRDRIIPGLIESHAEAIAQCDIPAVGFSCTFNQVMASLALAQKIKQLKPETKVLMGGPSFDGEMGLAYHRKYPEIIDHVFMGEADLQIADIARAVDSQKPLQNIPGITVWEHGEVSCSQNQVTLSDMDRAAMPNYDDYFEQRLELEHEGAGVPEVGPLPFESSRGCWWASKSHCIFCGINGSRHMYRAKAAQRVVSELEELSSRYAALSFKAADNIIDPSYPQGLFPLIEKTGHDYSLYYQVRTTLKKKELQALQRGKVILVQAGIESFSDHVLKIMRKGVSCLQNVQFLKWCQDLGIDVAYFILYGFPGETAEDYQKAAELLPFIHHLQPPRRMQPVELYRFSPMFENPAACGIDEMYTRELASYVYPEDRFDHDFLYSVIHYSAQTEKSEEYVNDFRLALGRWNRWLFPGQTQTGNAPRQGFPACGGFQAWQAQTLYSQPYPKGVVVAVRRHPHRQPATAKRPVPFSGPDRGYAAPRVAKSGSCRSYHR